jgi:hypothetical protein
MIESSRRFCGEKRRISILAEPFQEFQVFKKKKKHGSWWEIATQKSRFIGEIMSNPN